jgi:hypothetical protein
MFKLEFLFFEIDIYISYICVKILKYSIKYDKIKNGCSKNFKKSKMYNKNIKKAI